MADYKYPPEGSGGGGGSGTVTSVGMSVPSALLAVSGSPVTTTGTLAVTLPTRAANLIFAGPNTGAAAAPTFRSLVAADIPSLPASQITSGTLAVAQGGTNLGSYTAGDVLYATGATTLAKLPIGTAGQVLKVNSGATAPEWGAGGGGGGIGGSTGGVDLAILVADGTGGSTLKSGGGPTITGAGALSINNVDARIWLDSAASDYSIWKNSANSSIGLQIFASSSTMNHRWEQSVYSINDPNGFIVLGLTGTTGAFTIQGADNNGFNDAVSVTLRAGNGAGSRTGGDLTVAPGSSGSGDDGALTLGLASRAQAAVGGYPYMPTIAGDPSGTPTAKTGFAPFVFNPTNGKLFIYDGSAWKSVTLT